MIDRRQDSLLRLPAVRERTGLPASTINRREAAGTLPRRVRIGENSVAWYLSDVESFVVDPFGYRVDQAA